MKPKQCPICGSKPEYSFVDGCIYRYHCAVCYLIRVEASTRHYLSKKWKRMYNSVKAHLAKGHDPFSKKHYAPRKPDKRRAFTALEIGAIKRAYLSGVLMRELAEEFGVSKACIQQLIRGQKTYKELA